MSERASRSRRLPVQPRSYSVPQAARALGISPTTVRRWIRRGTLPASREGPRGFRIREEDLEQASARAWARMSTPMPNGLPPITPPTPEELARRQALVATILQRRQDRCIAPLTAADLVHQARQEAGLVDARDR